jgi:hypothetical protein
MVAVMANTTFGQEMEYPEYDGENFSLEGALVLFKQSKSLQDFEKSLNEENNGVNNLDLNDDGQTDYITVEDIKDKDTHVIVLSTYLGDNERQDIATIGIEKTGGNTATLQIEGDENLYAPNTFVEPVEASGSHDSRLVVNVWAWPSVRYVYSPRYVVWKSPYRWRSYPKYWKPWKVSHYNVFYKRTAPHRVNYHRVSTRRVVVARKIYTPKRRVSTIVVKKNHKKGVVNKKRKAKVVKVRRE